MASLGSFGTVKPVEEQAEPDTFEWFGSTVRLTTDYNEVELVDLMESARDIDVDDPTSMVIVKDLLRNVVDRQDFDAFWKLAKANRQQIEDLAQLAGALMEAATSRPTRQPSDSSTGRLPTPQSSPAVSSSPVSPGRPDLVLLLEGGEQTRRELAAKVAAAV
jgi:hypothetical protein